MVIVFLQGMLLGLRGRRSRAERTHDNSKGVRSARPIGRLRCAGKALIKKIDLNSLYNIKTTYKLLYYLLRTSLFKPLIPVKMSKVATNTKKINRFDCLLDDDDEVVIPNKPKDEFPTLMEKIVNIHDKQPKKNKWLVAAPAPAPAPAPVEQPPKKDKKKKPSPKNKPSPKHKPAAPAAQPESKKDKKEDNKLKMLTQMNGGELPLAAMPMMAQQPTFVEKAKILPVKPAEVAIPSSWVTISADKTKPAKAIMTNYHPPLPPDENAIATNAINTVCNNYRKYRQEYIDTYGVDAYNEKYVSPWHDYHYFDRDDKYAPSIYEKFVPEYMPYLLMNNGTVTDFIFNSASNDVTTGNTNSNTNTNDDEFDVLGTISKYSNVNKYMYA